MNSPKIWCSSCGDEGTVKNRKWINGLAYCGTCFKSKKKVDRRRKTLGTIHRSKTPQGIVVVNPIRSSV